MKKVLSFALFLTPAILLAQPTFTPSLPDVTPIDSDIPLLVSAGIMYAWLTLRKNQAKKIELRS